LLLRCRVAYEIFEKKVERKRVEWTKGAREGEIRRERKEERGKRKTEVRMKEKGEKVHVRRD